MLKVGWETEGWFSCCDGQKWILTISGNIVLKEFGGVRVVINLHGEMGHQSVSGLRQVEKQISQHLIAYVPFSPHPSCAPPPSCVRRLYQCAQHQ